MKKCDICKVKYPVELLSAGICGICALAAMNKMHGDNRSEFGGEMAEQLRQDAIEFRKKSRAR